MNQLHNEKGYSLLLTLMLVLLFTIMGTALIAMTFNGLTRNETREDTIQSVDLATKGEEFIVADINKKTTDYVNGNTIVTNELFNENFTALLNKYKCSPSTANTDLKNLNDRLKTGLSTGISNICIESFTPYEDSLTKMAVTFRSTGLSGTKESHVRSTYLMGAQEVKEALKYSVSTFKKDNGQGGNLILHGGSELKGNINVENNLFITNYSYGLGKWLKSTKPKILNSKFYLNNDVYTFKNNIVYSDQDLYEKTECRFIFFCGIPTNALNYNNHTKFLSSTEHYSKIPVPTQESFKNLFLTGSVVEKENTNLNDVPLFYDVNDSFISLNNSNFNFSSVQPTNTQEYTQDRKKQHWKYHLINSNRTIDTSNKTQNGIKYESDLYIKDEREDRLKKDIIININKPIYIKGDLIIGDLDYNANDEGTYDKIVLNGSVIFVEGKVRVQGVNLKANGNLYVKGDNVSTSYTNYKEPNSTLGTKFYELTLSGLNGNNTGELIVFTKKEMQIANISENKPTPSVIEGYFYSEDSMELYGFGSNLKIVGGVSANNITMNAMRGDSLLSCSSSSYQKIGARCFDTDTIQLQKSTRLTVEYNKEILETYSRNQNGLFVNISEEDVIEEVRLLDREKIQ